MRYSWVASCAVGAVLGCSDPPPADYSVIDNCTPGVSPNTVCTVIVRLAGLPQWRRGGLKWMDRNLQQTPDFASYVLMQSVEFNTNYKELLHFTEKTIGSPAKHSSANPAALEIADDYDYWVTSDGTWVISSGVPKELRWYSLPYVRVPTPEYMKVTAERAGLRPAPVSAAIWRALGRFIIDHPATQP